MVQNFRQKPGLFVLEEKLRYVLGGLLHEQKQGKVGKDL